MIQQKADDLFVTLLAGKVERRLSGVAEDVHGGTVVKEELHHLLRPAKLCTRTFAPISSRYAATSALPEQTAAVRAVAPCSLAASIAVPASRISRTFFRFPSRAATCRTVSPPSSSASQLAPSFKRQRTISFSPFHAATYGGVFPLPFTTVQEAPCWTSSDTKSSFPFLMAAKRMAPAFPLRGTDAANLRGNPKRRSALSVFRIDTRAFVKQQVCKTRVISFASNVQRRPVKGRAAVLRGAVHLCAPLEQLGSDAMLTTRTSKVQRREASLVGSVYAPVIAAESVRNAFDATRSSATWHPQAGAAPAEEGQCPHVHQSRRCAVECPSPCLAWRHLRRVQEEQRPLSAGPSCTRDAVGCIPLDIWSWGWHRCLEADGRGARAHCKRQDASASTHPLRLTTALLHGRAGRPQSACSPRAQQRARASSRRDLACWRLRLLRLGARRLHGGRTCKLDGSPYIRRPSPCQYLRGGQEATRRPACGQTVRQDAVALVLEASNQACCPLRQYLRHEKAIVLPPLHDLFGKRDEAASACSRPLRPPRRRRPEAIAREELTQLRQHCAAQSVPALLLLRSLLQLRLLCSACPPAERHRASVVLPGWEGRERHYSLLGPQRATELVHRLSHGAGHARAP
eukprot:scaffold11_cov257-Pinguiococcus_pyrenoidosus.AAC.27